MLQRHEHEPHGIICEWYWLKLWSKPEILNETDPNDGLSPILWLIKPLM